MARLDGKGPLGKGPEDGRKLGKCVQLNDIEKLDKLGKGMGLKRKSDTGKGMGKRLRSGDKI